LSTAMRIWSFFSSKVSWLTNHSFSTNEAANFFPYLHDWLLVKNVLDWCQANIDFIVW
jgi:hypothetical protein